MRICCGQVHANRTLVRTWLLASQILRNNCMHELCGRGHLYKCFSGHKTMISIDVTPTALQFSKILYVHVHTTNESGACGIGDSGIYSDN